MFILDLITILILVFATIPVLVFSIEIFYGLFPTATKNIELEKNNKLSSIILIPAHNEKAVIAKTLSNLCEIKSESDHIIVIADNCSDETACIAREFDVEVIERHHDTQRGKGYALAYGFEFARTKPSDFVIVVDADCILSNNAIHDLKQYSNYTLQPVQGSYLIVNEGEAKLSSKIAEFALLVKNLVRAKGMDKLGISLPLLGSGMIFPWNIFEEMELASGDIVEDMKLGIELAVTGHRVRYLESAKITSVFPSSEEALASQRERWEHGHLAIMQRFIPILVREYVKSKRSSVVGVLLDFCIPPLSLLIMFLIGVLLCTILLAFFTQNIGSIFYSVALLGIISICVSLSWSKHARHIIHSKEIFAIPSYFLSKLGIYKKFLKKPAKSWVKTKRD